MFRASKTYPQGGRENFEILLDVKTKQLVGFTTTSWFTGYRSSKEEFFDPATSPDRNNPPQEKFKKGEIAGTITTDIVFDAKLDPQLFSLTPPEGFAIVDENPAPKISEVELVEWLGVNARVNGEMFTDTVRGLSQEQRVANAEKPWATRSDAERQFTTLQSKHLMDGNGAVIMQFAEDSTEPKTFRYLGKGVKLGDAERIVCFYKLKGATTYRAIYGDLTIKDVNLKDLPLPVEG